MPINQQKSIKTAASINHATKQKVALGMSGGVDSSVAAYLLKEQGYDVTGVFMQCWEAKADGCRADEDRDDAVKVAAKLDIPFISLDFVKPYKEKVISHFYEEYKKGRTPNPDVLCNKEIKFGLFLEWAMSEGYDSVATGHYARVQHDGNYHRLLKGIDNSKDQSYFLYLLNQHMLSKTMFPLGDLKKSEIRQIAKEQGFHNAEKPDSVGICFIGEVDMKDFLKAEIEPKIGNVVNTKGEVLGEHDGVWFYTIGQRHGFRINKYVGLPLYVVDKNVDKNELIVGFVGEVNSSAFEVQEMHWVGEKPELPLSCDVRIRHLGELHASTLSLKDSSAAVDNEKAIYSVTLDEPVFGIAPGQSAVFYIGDELIGGGVIS